MSDPGTPTPDPLLCWVLRVLGHAARLATRQQQVGDRSDEPPAAMAQVTEEPVGKVMEEPPVAVTEEPVEKVTEPPPVDVTEEPPVQVTEEPQVEGTEALAPASNVNFLAVYAWACPTGTDRTLGVT